MSSELATVYRATGEAPERTEVRADYESVSCFDADGYQVYDSTHFSTRAAAWSRILIHRGIELEWAAKDVEGARRQVVEAEQRLAEAGLELARVRRAIAAEEEKWSGSDVVKALHVAAPSLAENAEAILAELAEEREP